MKQTGYNMYRELPGVGYEEAVERVTEALKDEGFGILTTIDVRDTLRQKLDVGFRPYVILGACNPSLAHRALTTEDSIGLVLPCNVVVAETDGGSEVAIARPRSMMDVAESDSIRPVADGAEEGLQRAIASL
jgi:uncharacterized protein (DUF302 family)